MRQGETSSKPEAEVESVVCWHLYWLIAGSNDVWTVDKSSKDSEQFNRGWIKPLITPKNSNQGNIFLACAAAYHLWYLQVRAPLTSSLMEAGSWMSSRITTRGHWDVLDSLSIWLARLERYSCRSWERERDLSCEPNGQMLRFTENILLRSPCRTGGAC